MPKLTLELPRRHNFPHALAGVAMLATVAACASSTGDDCTGDNCQGQGGNAQNNGSGGNGPNGFGGNSQNTGGNSQNTGGNSQNTGGNGQNNGSGGSAIGSGGSGGGSGGSGPVAGGGYITTGTWKGYGWTAVGGMATIDPKDFSKAAGFPLCAKGSVSAGTSNVALVGLNLNQESGTNKPTMSITPTKKGIKVTLANPGGSTLRLQIQGPKGGTDENDRWCATIPGNGGFIAYEAFNTQCWSGGMGKAYAMQPIVAAMVLVPGTMGVATNFDFCLNGLIEADSDAPVGGTGCMLGQSPGEGGGTVTGDQTRSVTRAGRNYIVQNNVWNGNKTAQTLQVTGVSYEVTAQGNSQGTNGAPASYPSVFMGSNFGRTSSGSGLPKQVKALKAVPTGWRWSSGNAGGQWNASYDVWFSKSAAGDTGTPSAGYLMVWLHDPSNAQPLGSPAGTEQIAGKSWQVWTCPGSCQLGVSVISYVPANGASISELSFDLKDFIENARQKYSNVMNGDWYLSNIFAGFEIWNGGLGLKTQDFCAVVE